jgi:hypothetical protein
MQHSLGLSPLAGTESLLLFTEKKSPRLHYTCSFVFGHVLGKAIEVTDDFDFFLSSPSILKLNYSNRNSQGIYALTPNALLFETGVRPLPEVPKNINGEIVFFGNAEKDQQSLWPFDVLATAFYFISRMEEWQITERDKHDRFELHHSVLAKIDAHLSPVVDKWIHAFYKHLCAFYKAPFNTNKTFKVVSTIDVDNLFAYRHKGLIRTAGAMVKDVLKADFANLGRRLAVISGRQKDPFDVYEEVGRFCAERQIPLLYFFLFRNGTPYDRTVDPRSDSFNQVFDIIQRFGGGIGIHPSYHAAYKPEMMQEEIRRLASRLNKPVHFSRQHFLRFNIRSTPQQLMKEGIEADFSMGFASGPGFRAGTSFPFYYYDFNLEMPTPLLFVPFCVMDGAYTVYQNQAPEEAMASMLELAKQVKQVNGIFISVYHERSFSDHLYKGYGSLYKNLHQQLKGI